MRFHVIVMACAGLVSSARADSSPSELPSGGSAAAYSTADTAVSAQPQVPGLRDGTIGIPSEGGATGLQAFLSNQITSKGVDTDAFAKLGGLSFTDWLTIEVLAETFSARVPRTLIDRPPVLPNMFSAGLSDIGFRFRIRLSSGAPNLTKQHITPCIGKRRVAAGAHASLTPNGGAEPPDISAADVAAKRLAAKAAASDAELPNAPPTARKQQADKNAELETAQRLNTNQVTLREFRSECTTSLFELDTKLSDPELYARALMAIQSGWTLSAGGRFLRRASAEAGGEDSEGIAGELALQYIDQGDQLGQSLFVSGAALHLAAANDKVGTMPALFPAFNELRLVAGYELRFNTGETVIPRVGVYGSISQARWVDPFAMVDQDRHVRGYQYEAALYLSGHFLGGFTGLVSFGAVVPYGNEKTQYIFSLVPSIGAPLGAKDGAK